LKIIQKIRVQDKRKKRMMVVVVVILKRRNKRTRIMLLVNYRNRLEIYRFSCKGLLRIVITNRR